MHCKMKAMIMDMCILSDKTQCFLLLGHVVDVGAGKLRCFTVELPLKIAIFNSYVNVYQRVPLSWFPVMFFSPSRDCMISIEGWYIWRFASKFMRFAMATYVPKENHCNPHEYCSSTYHKP